MKEGLGVFLWKIAVALYLIANGVLGLTKNLRSGDFYIIFNRMFSGDALNVFVAIASVIALAAGILILLEMLQVRVSFLDTLLLIIAVIWAVYIVIEIIGWITKGVGDNGFFYVLQMLAVHLMVFSSLLIASRKA